MGGGGPSTSPAPPPAGQDGPSLFTALQEQRGLKLEAGTGGAPVLVIDSANAPTAA